MNTYAVKPQSPFIPVLFIRANTAFDALTEALTLHPVVAIWPVKTQPIH